MLKNIWTLGLGTLIHFSSPRLPVYCTPEANRSSLNIRSLFSIGLQENITYPPIDIAGPDPRAKWIQAYQRAKIAGLIPAIPKSKIVNYRPVYPTSYQNTVCNPGYNNCNLTDDVMSAPAGTAGISFDDGPQPPSLGLLDYLKSQSQKATHFLIGSRIISNLRIFQTLDRAEEHLAVHTFSHPMMTSLTDHQILGEIGWTMQLIHDYSQRHLIARYWRPPYGDVDQRVDAIARHVFGLETIMWRYDPRDWCLSDAVPKGSACSLGNGPQSSTELDNELDVFIRSAKQNGLLILEHEQSRRAVAGFKLAFPLIKKLHWVPKAIPDLFNMPWYQ